MRRINLLLCFMLAGMAVFSQKKSGTHWIQLAEAEKNLLENKKPVLIDLYTDWCGWCKVMDRKTWSDKNVAAYLNARFSPVKIDAETVLPISWNQQKYTWRPDIRTHEFAMFVAGNRLSFPTIIIIPEPGGAPQAIPGYMKPKEIEVILKYFGEGHWKTIDFPAFHKSFKGDW